MLNTELLQKLASDTATPADYQQFNLLLEALSPSEQQQLIQQYEAILVQQQGGTVPESIAQKIAARVADHEKQQYKTKVIHLTRWIATGTAAAALAAITWFAWPFRSTTPGANIPVAATPVNDKEPATAGATLTLANGSTIVLDTLINGEIALQGNTQVTKKDGQVVYMTAAQQTNNTSIAYNTLATPRGRQFQLVLPDGSKVWLNAASSIRYPIAFADTERKVTITGEVYFEVAKRPEQPFKVQFSTTASGSGEVEVLGTHFNVNTYSDEPFVKTTLIEGKVKVKTANDKSEKADDPEFSVVLKPGEQSLLSRAHSQFTIDHSSDLEQVMAWKNGRFRFNNAPIKDIMRQVSRWYDVDIIYSKTFPEKNFTADISRQTRLSEFLKVLELSGYRFTINEKTLTVTM